ATECWNHNIHYGLASRAGCRGRPGCLGHRMREGLAGPHTERTSVSRRGRRYRWGPPFCAAQTVETHRGIDYLKRDFRMGLCDLESFDMAAAVTSFTPSRRGVTRPG